MADGAALIVSHGTALYALRERARLQPGETLLVTGASGGVGLAAVELGCLLGARVIAAASSEKKLNLALLHGAQAGLVYPAESMDSDAARAFGNTLKESLGALGADVVLDVTGGQYAQSFIRAIAWQGRYLVVGFAAGIPKLPLNLVLLKGCDVLGVSSGEYIARERGKFDASHRELLTMYSQGLIRPHVSQRFPLERSAEAISLIASRQAVGKLVVMAMMLLLAMMKEMMLLFVMMFMMMFVVLLMEMMLLMEMFVVLLLMEMLLTEMMLLAMML